MNPIIEELLTRDPPEVNKLPDLDKSTDKSNITGVICESFKSTESVVAMASIESKKVCSQEDEEKKIDTTATKIDKTDVNFPEDKKNVANELKTIIDNAKNVNAGINEETSEITENEEIKRDIDSHAKEPEQQTYSLSKINNDDEDDDEIITNEEKLRRQTEDENERSFNVSDPTSDEAMLDFEEEVEDVDIPADEEVDEIIVPDGADGEDLTDDRDNEELSDNKALPKDVKDSKISKIEADLHEKETTRTYEGNEKDEDSGDKKSSSKYSKEDEPELITSENEMNKLPDLYKSTSNTNNISESLKSTETIAATVIEEFKDVCLQKEKEEKVNTTMTKNDEIIVNNQENKENVANESKTIIDNDKNVNAAINEESSEIKQNKRDTDIHAKEPKQQNDSLSKINNDDEVDDDDDEDDDDNEENLKRQTEDENERLFNVSDATSDEAMLDFEEVEDVDIPGDEEVDEIIVPDGADAEDLTDGKDNEDLIDDKALAKDVKYEEISQFEADLHEKETTRTCEVNEKDEDSSDKKSSSKYFKEDEPELIPLENQINKLPDLYKSTSNTNNISESLKSTETIAATVIEEFKDVCLQKENEEKVNTTMTKNDEIIVNNQENKENVANESKTIIDNDKNVNAAINEECSEINQNKRDIDIHAKEPKQQNDSLSKINNDDEDDDDNEENLRRQTEDENERSFNVSDATSDEAMLDFEEEVEDVEIPGDEEVDEIIVPDGADAEDLTDDRDNEQLIDDKTLCVAVKDEENSEVKASLHERATFQSCDVDEKEEDSGEKKLSSNSDIQYVDVTSSKHSEEEGEPELVALEEAESELIVLEEEEPVLVLEADGPELPVLEEDELKDVPCIDKDSNCQATPICDPLNCIGNKEQQDNRSNKNIENENIPLSEEDEDDEVQFVETPNIPICIESDDDNEGNSEDKDTSQQLSNNCYEDKNENCKRTITTATATVAVEKNSLVARTSARKSTAKPQQNKTTPNKNSSSLNLITQSKTKTKQPSNYLQNATTQRTSDCIELLNSSDEESSKSHTASSSTQVQRKTPQNRTLLGIERNCHKNIYNINNRVSNNIPLRVRQQSKKPTPPLLPLSTPQSNVLNAVHLQPDLTNTTVSSTPSLSSLPYPNTNSSTSCTLMRKRQHGKEENEYTPDKSKFKTKDNKRTHLHNSSSCYEYEERKDLQRKSEQKSLEAPKQRVKSFESEFIQALAIRSKRSVTPLKRSERLAALAKTPELLHSPAKKPKLYSAKLKKLRNALTQRIRLNNTTRATATSIKQYTKNNDTEDLLQATWIENDETEIFDDDEAKIQKQQQPQKQVHYSCSSEIPTKPKPSHIPTTKLSERNQGEIIISDDDVDGNGNNSGGVVSSQLLSSDLSNTCVIDDDVTSFGKILPKETSPQTNPSAINTNSFEEFASCHRATRDLNNSDCSPSLSLPSHAEKNQQGTIDDTDYGNNYNSSLGLGFPKNVAPQMFVNDENKEKCVICNQNFIGCLVDHYVNEHRGCQIYSSRLYPSQIKLVKQGCCKVSNVDQFKINKSFEAFCIFCQKKLCFTLPYWWVHFTRHTGEFAYRCTGCGLRKPTPDFKRHLDQECPKASIAQDYLFTLKAFSIEASVCNLCNYVQLYRNNIETHLHIEHNIKQISNKHIQTILILSTTVSGIATKHSNNNGGALSASLLSSDPCNTCVINDDANDVTSFCKILPKETAPQINPPTINNTFEEFTDCHRATRDLNSHSPSLLLPSNAEKNQQCIIIDDHDANSGNHSLVPALGFPKNVDPQMVNNDENKERCVICNQNFNNLVYHYVNGHPGCEVYNSRLSPSQIKLVKEGRGLTSNVNPTRNRLFQYEAFCIFCQKYLSFRLRFWYEHLTMHTGEYAYRCIGCGLRNLTLISSKQHQTKGCPKANGIAQDYCFDKKHKIDFKVCNLCNYVQLHRKNIERHLHVQHNIEHILPEHMQTILFLSITATMITTSTCREIATRLSNNSGGALSLSSDSSNGCVIDEDGNDVTLEKIAPQETPPLPFPPTINNTFEEFTNCHRATIDLNSHSPSLLLPSNAEKNQQCIIIDDHDANSGNHSLVPAFGFPKNVDPQMVNNGENKERCVICNQIFNSLVYHYVNGHPGCEVYNSRLSASQIKFVKEGRGVISNVNPTRNRLFQYEAFCIFCQKYLSFMLRFWYEHLTMHTGEYAYRCIGCGLRNPTRISIKQHQTKGCRNANGIAQDYCFDTKHKIDFKVCNLCNYVQLHRKNIERHLHVQHNIEHILPEHMQTILFLSISATMIATSTSRGIATRLSNNSGGALSPTSLSSDSSNACVIDEDGNDVTLEKIAPQETHPRPDPPTINHTFGEFTNYQRVTRYLNNSDCSPSLSLLSSYASNSNKELSPQTNPPTINILSEETPLQTNPSTINNTEELTNCHKVICFKIITLADVTAADPT